MDSEAHLQDWKQRWWLLSWFGSRAKDQDRNNGCALHLLWMMIWIWIWICDNDQDCGFAFVWWYGFAPGWIAGQMLKLPAWDGTMVKRNISYDDHHSHSHHHNEPPPPLCHHHHVNMSSWSLNHHTILHHMPLTNVIIKETCYRHCHQEYLLACS